MEEAALGRAGLHCTHCGSEQLEPGFLQDDGGYATYGRWVSGWLKPVPLKLTRRWPGRQTVAIDAHRCTVCSHVELFVGPPNLPRPDGTTAPR